MDEGKALLKAVCDHPDEDTPRLVYADWLEEHDDSARAEFIRVQCELAQIEGDDPRRPALARREHGMLAAGQDEWAKDVPRGLINPYFRRGFVEGVHCQGGNAFVQHGRAFFASHPASAVWIYGSEEHLYGAARCPHLARVHELIVSHAHRGGLEALLASQFVTGLRGLHLQHLQVPSFRERLADFLPILAPLAGAGLTRLGLCFRGFEASEVRGFARLGLLSRLEELTFDYEGLNDATARTLADTAALAGLRALQFRGSRVGDVGVRHLAESPHLAGLRRLSLYGARRVTDDGFAALARSPHLGNLTDLDLRYATVTHDTVRMLIESPNLPRLSRLMLTGTAAAPRDAQIDSASWHTCPPDHHPGVVWVAEMR